MIWTFRDKIFYCYGLILYRKNIVIKTRIHEYNGKIFWLLRGTSISAKSSNPLFLHIFENWFQKDNMRIKLTDLLTTVRYHHYWKVWQLVSLYIWKTTLERCVGETTHLVNVCRGQFVIDFSEGDLGLNGLPGVIIKVLLIAFFVLYLVATVNDGDIMTDIGYKPISTSIMYIETFCMIGICSKQNNSVDIIHCKNGYHKISPIQVGVNFI